MGRLKELQIEMWKAGLELPLDQLDRLVCDECIEDEALQRWSPKTEQDERCDFCGAESVGCRTVYELFRYMTDAIRTEWDDPRNGVGWDAREGGWVGAAITDAWDLCDTIGGPLANEKLADLFITSIELEWSELDPYGLRPEERLTYGWDRFAAAVKAGPVVRAKPSWPVDRDLIDPADMLEEIGRLLDRTNYNLLKILPAATRVVRGRSHDSDERPCDAKELGSPPPAKTTSLRMSAEGSSVFYGAETDETIRAELARATEPELTIATWSLVSPMCYLDLVGLASVPSIFDAVGRPVRSAMTFLHGFAEAIARAPEEDADYIPTQCFAEFLRGTVRDHEGRRVEAIRYRSAMRAGEACWVFFIDSSGCADPDGITADTRLVLDPASVRLQPHR